MVHLLSELITREIHFQNSFTKRRQTTNRNTGKGRDLRAGAGREGNLLSRVFGL